MSSSVKAPMEPAKKTKTGFNRWFSNLNAWQKFGYISGITALSVGVAGAAALGVWFHYNKLPDLSILETYRPVEAVQIYDRFDHLTSVISGEQDRQVIKLNQISPQMRKAMMAAEDHEFYSHGGINPTSIGRAILVNLQAGRIVEGGSTITQQLVKNLFFPGEPRSFNRKIKEFFLALQVDQKYSKDKILEMYLNQIYFGNQAYGIERAAQRYFNKDASKLNLAEAAFLAGVVKAPSYLSDSDNRKNALARQREVLDKMVEYKFIPREEADKAKTQKLAFRKFVNPYQKYPFYISYVVDQLRQKYGSQEMQRGLKVYTNLDPVAQQQGEKVLTDGIKHAPAGVTQGALASVRVNDGAVLALVGGVGQFERHQWNRAVSPHTMGSSFKPFVYLSGFLKGLTPDSVVLDEPVTIQSGGHAYSPKNFDHEFRGPMPIRMALALSRNVCAIRVAVFSGINHVIETARAAGITSRLDPYIPVALGACAASPLEMAGAYSTFARGGVQMTPQVFRRVESPDGKVLDTYSASPRKVFESQPVALLVDAMQTVVQKGTGILAQLPGRPVAGKTGTSDRATDIWFIGFTPDTCTAVWGGNDHNKTVYGRSVTGGVVMAAIWKKYMVGYYNTHPTPVAYFTPPSKWKSSVASADVPGSDSSKSDGIVAAKSADSDSPISGSKSDDKSADLAKGANKTKSGTKLSAKTEPEKKLTAAKAMAAEAQEKPERDWVANTETTTDPSGNVTTTVTRFYGVVGKDGESNGATLKRKASNTVMPVRDEVVAPSSADTYENTSPPQASDRFFHSRRVPAAVSPNVEPMAPIREEESGY
jgi:penicillin-binding protein 1A